MRKILIALPVVLLAGCSSFHADIERRPLEVNKVLLTIDPQVEFDSFRKAGDATWQDIVGVLYA